MRRGKGSRVEPPLAKSTCSFYKQGTVLPLNNESRGDRVEIAMSAAESCTLPIAVGRKPSLWRWEWRPVNVHSTESVLTYHQPGMK